MLWSNQILQSKASFVQKVYVYIYIKVIRILLIAPTASKGLLYYVRLMHDHSSVTEVML